MATMASSIFVFLAFLLVFVFWQKRNFSNAVLFAGLFGILTHQILSFLNIIYGPFPFAALDAYSFHLHGIQRVDIAEFKTWNIGSDIYKSLLATVYGLFGKSLWLGQTFSILFFSMSCVLMMYFAKVFRLGNSYCAIAILCFGLLPSSLLYGSFTLREPIITAFFMSAVLLGHLALNHDSRSRQWLLWLAAVVCFLIMGVFHMVLLVYAMGISVILFLLIHAQRASWQQLVITIFSGSILFVVLLLVIKEVLPANLSDDYFAMLRIQVGGELVSIPEAISIYHQTANSTGASTQYNAELEFKTWGKMAFVFFYSYVFYLGWPLTGDYFQLSTLVIFSEAIFRVVGILCLVLLVFGKSKLDESKQVKNQWIWLMLVYFSLTFLWNIGTSNHGQALRHHYMTEWILILAIVFYWQRLKSIK